MPPDYSGVVRIRVTVRLNQSLNSVYHKHGRKLDLDNIDIPERSTLGDLYQQIGLSTHYIGFVTVNGEIVHDATRQLKNADVIILYPLLAGGR